MSCHRKEYSRQLSTNSESELLNALQKDIIGTSGFNTSIKTSFEWSYTELIKNTNLPKQYTGYHSSTKVCLTFQNGTIWWGYLGTLRNVKQY